MLNKALWNKAMLNLMPPSWIQLKIQCYHLGLSETPSDSSRASVKPGPSFAASLRLEAGDAGGGGGPTMTPRC